MTFTSLYIHIPFCAHRCGYCDFNTYAGLQRFIPEYTQALCEEIGYLHQSNSKPFSIYTIYFGGGTPSLVPPDQIKAVLNHIRDQFDLSPALEISLEANPGTVSAEYFSQLRDFGVNRISLGMQSANQNELSLLERQHTYNDVVRAVGWVREAGITNLNLDLIFGLPNQDLNTWLTSLEAALSLVPEHLSLYALTLEHGTPMQHKVEAGVLPEPDADLAADMYEAASERLCEAGFIQYEISNWARINQAGELNSCQHNLQYWRNLPYIGIGAGAHGFVNHYRMVNVATPDAYINRMKNESVQPIKQDVFPRTPATTQIHFINKDTEAGEMMMMGLRLIMEGVSNREFHHRFGIHLQDKYRNQINRLISVGLLEWNGTKYERLRLTQKGRLLGNQVFTEFI